MTIVKTAGELHKIVAQVLIAVGADERNANRVADHLVLTNLSGVDTHGVNLLPPYVERIQAGDIIPNAWPSVVKETPTSALVTGNWTFGHVTAKYALDLAIEKAAIQNIAVVGVVQVNHIGRLGEYAEMAAAKNMILMISNAGFAEESPTAVPYGGRKPVLHTNPWAMGFPAGQEPPMVFDFATTASSQVKVTNARRRGDSIPLGWIVDKDGQPSTDPNAYFDSGALLPFGGHKGYALMMAAEFAGRLVTGADEFADPKRGGPGFRHAGVLMIAFKADLFRPFADYAASADELEHRVRAVPPAPGFKEVLVPGDMETRNRAIRQRDGIPLEDAVWDSLARLAASLSLPGFT